MNPFKKNDASLSKKLKGALTDLTVDIFGYERWLLKISLTAPTTFPIDFKYRRIVSTSGFFKKIT